MSDPTKATMIFDNVVADSRVTLTVVGTTLLAPTTMPLENMQDADRSNVTRFDSATSFKIRGTYGGESVGASGIGAFRNNLTSAAKWQFVAYENADFTGAEKVNTLEQNAIPGIPFGSLFFGVDPLGKDYYHFFGWKQSFMWFDLAAFKSWELTITDTANPDGYIDICCLMIGQRFEFAYNPEYGMKLGWEEGSVKWETDGGTEHVDIGEGYRALAFDVKAIPEEDRMKWMELTRRVGLGYPVMISIYPTGTDVQKAHYTMLAFFTVIPKLASTLKDHDSTNVSMREA